jgi:hypothetical protein
MPVPSFAVEIFTEHDPSGQLAIRRREPVEMPRHVERNRRLFPRKARRRRPG